MILWKFYLKSLGFDIEIKNEDELLYAITMAAIKISEQFYIGTSLNESTEFKQVFLPFQLVSHKFSYFITNFLKNRIGNKIAETIIES